MGYRIDYFDKQIDEVDVAGAKSSTGDVAFQYDW